MSGRWHHSFWLRVRNVFPLLLAVLCLGPGPVSANPAGPIDTLSRDGTSGFGAVTSSRPVDYTLRVFTDADYTRRDGIVYEGDDAWQARGFLGFSAAGPQGWELALQSRFLRTRSQFVDPQTVRAGGDALFSAKYGYAFNREWSAGLLVQGRHYEGAGGAAPGLWALGSWFPGPLEIALQAGWIGESAVDLGAVPTAVRAFAWQKPDKDALALRTGVAWQTRHVRPYLVYSTEYYAGEQSPQRLSPGVAMPAGLPGLTTVAHADIRLWGTGSAALPAEPPWRMGLNLQYSVPVGAIWKALFPPPGSFAAVVTDASSGKSVAGLRATLDGRTLEPEANGRLRYDGKPGRYLLALEAPGYLPVTDVVSIEPAQLIARSYALPRNAGGVRGLVIKGERPGDAVLAIEGAGRFTSDAKSGLFSFELPPNAYAMTVSAPGFITERRTFVVRLGKEVVFDRLVLRPAPVLRPVVIETPKPVTAPAQAPVPAPAVAVTPAPAPEVPPVPVPVLTPPPVPAPAVSLPSVPAPETPAARAAKAAKRDAEEEAERREWLVKEEPVPERLESPIFFKFASAEIDPRAYPAFDRLAEMLRDDPNLMRVIVEGRADVIGSRDVNIRFAAERAENVVRELIKRGVPEAKIATTITVYQRVARGQSDDERADDRRVGFRMQRREGTR